MRRRVTIESKSAHGRGAAAFVGTRAGDGSRSQRPAGPSRCWRPRYPWGVKAPSARWIILAIMCSTMTRAKHAATLRGRNIACAAASARAPDQLRDHPSRPPVRAPQSPNAGRRTTLWCVGAAGRVATVDWVVGDPVDERAYEAELWVMPKDVAYRPERRTPWPRIAGFLPGRIAGEQLAGRRRRQEEAAGGRRQEEAAGGRGPHGQVRPLSGGDALGRGRGHRAACLVLDAPWPHPTQGPTRACTSRCAAARRC